MATTIPTLTLAELRAGLHELLELADRYAALEDTIESKVMELKRSDYEDTRYASAIAGELAGVFEAAAWGDESGENAHELRERLGTAIDVVDLAIQRSGSDG